MEVEKNIERDVDGTSYRSLICQVKENLQQKHPKKFHIVIDFEQIILMQASFKYSEEDIQTYYPNLSLLRLSYSSAGSSYLVEDLFVIFPNFDTLILTILSWPGWTVDFFSDYEQPVVDIFIKELIQLIIDKSKDTSLAQLFHEHNVLRGFSRKHIMKSKNNHYKDLRVIIGDNNKENQTQSIDIEAHNKSDQDIDNVILIDTNHCHANPSQLPLIVVQRDIEFAKRFEFELDSDYDRYNYGNNDIDECIDEIPSLHNKCFKQWFHPIDNASYIMGIILTCRNMIIKSHGHANDRIMTLKTALKKVLIRKQMMQLLYKDRLNPSMTRFPSIINSNHAELLTYDNDEEDKLFWVQYHLHYLSQPCQYDEKLNCIRKHDPSFLLEYNKLIEIGEQYFAVQFPHTTVTSKTLGIKLHSSGMGEVQAEV